MTSAYHYKFTADDATHFSFATVMENTVTEEKCVQWCVEAGLIESSLACPKCGNAMRRSGKRWRCSKRSKHADGKQVERSVYINNGFLKDAKMPLHKLVRLLYSWCMRVKHADACAMADATQETVSNWYIYCRVLCSRELLSTEFKVTILYCTMTYVLCS